jgi:hypothetical protein
MKRNKWAKIKKVLIYLNIISTLSLSLKNIILKHIQNNIFISLKEYKKINRIMFAGYNAENIIFGNKSFHSFKTFLKSLLYINFLYKQEMYFPIIKVRGLMI